jgi:hypothetical protein
VDGNISSVRAFAFGCAVIVPLVIDFERNLKELKTKDPQSGEGENGCRNKIAH